jgi:hypothetical protein
MGYSHCFSRSRPASASSWRVFTNEVRKILAHPDLAPLLCEEYDKPNNPPVITDNVVVFNGKGENGHETFYLERGKHSEFCKTHISTEHGKSYDLAVCCVLLSAHHHLKERVSSDGDWDEQNWVMPRVLYAKLTDRLVPCPWPQKQCVECKRFFKRNGHNWGGYEKCRKCGSGSRSCSKLGDVCMKCGSVNSFRKEKPRSWCYFCAQGYKNKDEAYAAVLKNLAALTAAIKTKNEEKARDQRLHPL